MNVATAKADVHIAYWKLAIIASLAIVGIVMSCMLISAYVNGPTAVPVKKVEVVIPSEPNSVIDAETFCKNAESVQFMALPSPEAIGVNRVAVSGTKTLRWLDQGDDGNKIADYNYQYDALENNVVVVKHDSYQITLSSAAMACMRKNK